MTRASVLLSESGCRDLNPGPLDPQSSALTKLRHSPYVAISVRRCVRRDAKSAPRPVRTTGQS
jgi:hypothetical protein